MGGSEGQYKDRCGVPRKTERESWGHRTPLEVEVNIEVTMSVRAGTSTPKGRWEGWGETGVVRKGRGAVQGHTFAVHATAPSPARHRHLVLVGTGVTTLPTEPWGTRAAARVQVTVAPLALAAWERGRMG